LREVDAKRCDLVRLQDDVAQLGQGRIADRNRDHPGLADAGVIALRKLWRRELRAFDKGRATKPWRRKAGMGPSAWGQRGAPAGDASAEIVDVRPYVEVEWQLKALAGPY
jgi:hypothetical protein